MSSANTRIFISTPSYNSEKTLSRTISSVLSQHGDFEIFYHVQDGGSKDGTVALLNHWKYLVESGQYPISCKKIHFSYASAPDNGMYDALCKGFSNLSMVPMDWMGWINSDDFLLQGAFSYLQNIDSGPLAKNVNWITPGTFAIANNGFVISQGPRPISSYIIKEGLCDGIHWDYIQQEGTFFRNQVWIKIDLAQDFLAYKLAGDWNLWRKMASFEKVYQSSYPLGIFNLTPGQLSQASKEEYLLEINNTIPQKTRLDNLKKVASSGTECLQLVTDWKSRTPTLKGININKLVAEKSHKLDQNNIANRIKLNLKRTGSVVAYDADWQYPAITEKHAYERILELAINDNRVVYLAFPWATLIDTIDNKRPHSLELLSALSELKKHIPSNTSKIVTACQHVLLPQHQNIFAEVGITDLFWSHAVKHQETIPNHPSIKIHPFPLYPVQALGETPPTPLQRDILYSFVGAKSNKWYLTQARSFIIDLLSADNRGYIIGRADWHYNKVVYDLQINKKTQKVENLVDLSATVEFKSILKRSIFSLCPSGSGPNSIRLWESIGLGAIPVILADTYLPPGDMALWQDAAVFCEETEAAIQALPGLLEEMAKDQALLERKRHAMRQLWMMYGPDCFVYDIHKLALQHALPLDQMNPTTNTDLQLYSKANDTAQLGALGYMIEKILQTNGTEQDLLRQLLSACSSRILIDSKKFAAMYNTNKKLQQVCNMAQKNQTKEADIFKRLLNMRGISATGESQRQ